LLEAAETGAALGGVYVYPVWDKDLFDYPVVAVAQADMAIPEFKWGFLIAVTFHRLVLTNGNEVYRHIERHEVEGTGDARKAVVLNALYKGTKDTIGVQVELTASEATLRFEPRVVLPFQELDVEYIPNIRPNRLFRANGEGVADIQGSESLLDAIDETYASWMRDIRLAKARIIVPRDYLRNDESGNATFDLDQEIYTTMDMEPSMDADARAMLAHQFAIRYMEHRETTREFIERVVSNAGYSPETVIGAEGAAAKSGAALRVSEHKTILTQRRKAGHWAPALSRLLYHLNLIDKEIFKSDALDIRPTVEMSDSIIDQPLELAQTALALKSAEAASTESRVRVVHPEWSDAEVAAEVARIKDDTAAAAQIDAEAKGTFGDPLAAPEARAKNFPTTVKDGKAGSKPPTPVPFAKKA
nr:hypothetical protein [Actinomycetota bacterium]